MSSLVLLFFFLKFSLVLIKNFLTCYCNSFIKNYVILMSNATYYFIIKVNVTFKIIVISKFNNDPS